MSDSENNNTEGLWSKYWAEQGLEVVHIEHARKTNLKPEDHKMYVVKIVWNKQGKDNLRYINGIACHWFTMGNKLEREVFSTKELIPYEIAKRGIQVINDWLNR